MIDLQANARALFASGKGILAADESTGTADKRLASYGIATGPEMRRLDRDLFLEAPEVEHYLSGVILFSETMEQKGSDKKLFPKSLAARGIAPGIKVDLGTEPFPGSPNELITNGLIGLEERLALFAKEGAVFTKWRAVIKIEGDALPTSSALVENAKRLASYAHLAQKAGLVPILEPEVLLHGTHSRLRAKEVIATTLSTVFKAVEDQNVDYTALIIKTAMALSGDESGHTDSPEEVAEATLDALMEAVPRKVSGIVFLSGGQTAEAATKNLAAITKRAKEVHAPWPLTFSFARALQDEALTVWKGKKENVGAARKAFVGRLKKVSEALG